MALKVTLVKSAAGAPDTQRRTLAGLGLKKLHGSKILQDTKAIRGMAFKVKHLVSVETVAGEAPKRQRMKPRKDRLRRAARAAEAAK